MVWQGEGVIATARQMMGKTNPQEALPGTIRGDFGLTVGKMSFTVLILQRVLNGKSTCGLTKMRSSITKKQGMSGFINSRT